MVQQIKTSIPTIKGLPIIGNLIDFRYNRLPLLQRVSEECGDIGRFYVGPTEVILLNNPKYIRKAFIEHAYSFRKPHSMTNLVQPVIGNGLFIAEGNEHIQQRKQIAPLFQHRNIPQYDTIITKHTKEIQASWKPNSIIDITNEIMKITLDTISNILFSKDMLQEFNTIRDNLNTIIKHINKNISSLLPTNAYPTQQNRKFKEATLYINTIIQKSIDEQIHSKSNETNILSILLQSGMDNKQIRDEIMNLFIAGHETTALAVIWTWYLLTKHQDTYKEIQNEIDTTLGGKEPTYKDISKLPLTTCAIKESLRLYPPAYLLARKALQDIEIEDYRIPAGKAIAISPYTLHRRSKYFDKPNTFNPSRFENDDHNQAYIPFGVGPRSCIGNHLAMLEIQMILITLAQKTTFEIIQEQNIAPQPLTVLYPNQAIRMIVRHR